MYEELPMLRNFWLKRYQWYVTSDTTFEIGLLEKKKVTQKKEKVTKT